MEMKGSRPDERTASGLLTPQSDPPPKALPGIAAMAAIAAGLSMLGQFAIATYLPAFAIMSDALHATNAQVQQSLTAYLLPFALMLPWHGAISDAVGRRRMVLLGCALFTIGSLVCAGATGIDMLHAGRVLQGISAGIGVIVGRAMVRDVFDGMQAQQVMALVAMIFALAPAIAPVCGGWLLLWTGWRSIFVFLALVSASLLVACWRWVPETLPPARRHPLHPALLARGYGSMLTHWRFVALTLANAGVNVGIYVYIFAAPTFVTRHLGLGAQSFGWLFIPIVAGIMLGSLVSHRMAGRISPVRSVLLGHAVMLFAGISNIVLTALHAPAMPWALIALPVYGAGMTITQPSLQLLALDCFPERRGLVSSGYVTVQQFGNFLMSALLVPLLLDSTVKLAVCMAALQLFGLAMFMGGRRGRAVVASS
ncbi:multidrug effflux MFS transporter [Cupriavidus pinatubonensis]|uniref:Bcr/CflA family efflux transporter n=1 Tax=Cupriavidus pinatubonensis TaxID=248026 RepID=A0ABN7ZIW5_9BURK|nr:multidrug effflux MFS transporter [Cupriavidus pinatubonensis]CAG9185938.1 Multidrug resistance protein MdtL [Cupriavidus pinatubonensis]